MVPVLSMAISLPLSAGSRDVYLSPTASHKEPENVRERVKMEIVIPRLVDGRNIETTLMAVR